MHPVTDTVGRVGLAFPVLLAVALLVSGAVGGPLTRGRQRLGAPFGHAGRRQFQRPFQAGSGSSPPTSPRC